MTLSESIKELRTKAFLSQESFAKEINVSIATVNRWEHGKARPNITAMNGIKKFCKDNDMPFQAIEQEWLDFSGEAIAIEKT